MCETYTLPIAPLRAPNRNAPQETATNSPSTEIDTMRQDATERNGNSCPRAREATEFRFPSLGMDCTQVAAECTGRLDLPSPSHHANRPNGTKIPTRLTSPNAADIVISTGRYSNIESTPQGRQASETAQILPRNSV